MNELRVLLIHPDPQLRHELRNLLREVDGIQVLGEAVSAFEAVELIDGVGYHALFLGVDLPEGVNGFELAQILSQRKHRPAMIFLAADEAHAFKAFELGATDYLLWPCSQERMKRTLTRLRQFPAETHIAEPGGVPGSVRTTEGDEETVQLALGEEEEDNFLKALRNAWDYNQSRPVEIEKLPISLEGRVILIPYSHIVFVEAYEDYSFVHTNQDKYLTSFRLKYLEDRLRMHRFFRVHRKFLVNLELVTEIASLPGSNFMLRTTGKKRIELPVSRRRIADLKQILGL
ncbi:two component transcriptional regulator, LytTR family [Desulfonatronum thiosulfatophilum]|uniref:Two component transcriptional regulator, LytTR family n=1 Tax=Desulfonatronum thiosulfatophilum TaxID=617002 RepID=A0A1G6CVY8_9BACT|nr:LytTR family DNA-binding domain-containing protein [Desulfonatronum thiosulfatophilum]SDB37049.1 two component transcriptional regulator, LytTR family [Desulfonatronum thiosulfatophilum]